MSINDERPDETSLVCKLARHIFAPATIESVRRVPEGASTRVYRVLLSNEAFYVRVLPEDEASFAPEAWVHTQLRACGVSVPEVIYWEHRNEALGRSVMITTEIRGRNLGYWMDAAATRAALIAAGRDLAVINSIAVKGFGWIRRASVVTNHLEAEHATNRTFLFEYLDADLALLREHGFTTGEMAAVEEVIKRCESWVDVPHAHLVHGDFDATHIFQEGGRYVGMIDFGEIRGADPLYDLGHFRMHDGETLPMETLPYLLEGYRQMMPLPVDVAKRISLLSLLIAIRALSRFLRSYPGETQRHTGYAVYAVIRREMAALGE